MKNNNIKNNNKEIKTSLTEIDKKYKEFANWLKENNYDILSKQKTNLTHIVKYDYTDITKEEIENIIIKDIKPSNFSGLKYVLYIMGVYGRYIENERLRNILLEEIETREIAEKCKFKRMFMTHTEFLQSMKQIESVQPINYFYYKTLLQAIYEGVYSRGYAEAIYNLRGSDLDFKNNIVTLRDKEGEWKINVSHKLLTDLYTLSQEEYLYRANSASYFPVKIVGVYSDTCFKTEERSQKKEIKTAKGAYGTYIRGIERLLKGADCNVYTLKNIYMSGVLHRLQVDLAKQNINLTDWIETNYFDYYIPKFVTNMGYVRLAYFKSNFIGQTDYFEEDIKVPRKEMVHGLKVKSIVEIKEEQRAKKKTNN